MVKIIKKIYKSIDIKIILMDTFIYLLLSNIDEILDINTNIKTGFASEVYFACNLYVGFMSFIGEFFVSLAYSMITKADSNRIKKILAYDLIFIFVYIIGSGINSSFIVLVYLSLQIIGVVLGYTLNNIISKE